MNDRGELITMNLGFKNVKKDVHNWQIFQSDPKLNSEKNIGE